MTRSGEVYCWGGIWVGTFDESHGECGGPGLTCRNHRVERPKRVLGVDNAVHVEVYDRNVCLLLDDHTMRCWGGNYHGEAGTGDQERVYNPAPGRW